MLHDDEGGCQLARVYEYMLHIYKDLSSFLSHTKQALITEHAKLELRFDILEL